MKTGRKWMPICVIFALAVEVISAWAQDQPARPSPESMATALRAEEAKGALWVKVSWDLAKEGGSKLIGAQGLVYLRSPKLLYAEERSPSGTNHPARGSVRVYDRNTGTWEWLVWTAEGVERKLDYKWFGANVCDPFVRGEFPETVYAPVSVYLGKSDKSRLGLLDVIETGKVILAEKRETVDGALCWVVGGTRALEFADDWKAYLDPEMSFCPRRIERVRDIEGVAHKSTVTYEEYSRMANGMWFPKRIRYRREDTGKDGKTTFSTSLFTVEETATGLPLRTPLGGVLATVIPESITTDAPKGTEILRTDRSGAWTLRGRQQ